MCIRDRPHAARHFVDVGADLFAQIGDLVDESDLGGEEGIGRVFDQLGGAPGDIEERRRIDVYKRQPPIAASAFCNAAG